MEDGPVRDDKAFQSIEERRAATKWLEQGEVLAVRGGSLVGGRIKIQGSKNAAQKFVPIAAVRPGTYVFENMPDISDTYAVLEIIEHLGGRVGYANGAWHLDTRAVTPREIPRELTIKSTGTFQFAGALLGRFGRAAVAPPGGDKIGGRPVDLHIQSFKVFGATDSAHSGLHQLEGLRLVGACYDFEIPSAGALINFLLAAVSAEGPSQVRNFPWDNDIAASCELLNLMGARIARSTNGEVLYVEPIADQHSEVNVSFQAPPDRNDTATWMIAGALSSRGVTLVKTDPNDVEPLISLFERNLGISSEFVERDVIRVTPSAKLQVSELLVEAGPSPRLHSDWAQMISVLLLACHGNSTLLDVMYESRYGQADGLRKMGGHIETTSRNVRPGTLMYDRNAASAQALEIEGPSHFIGSTVEGGDVRGAMALTLAACVADGVSRIRGAGQLARGYECLTSRLRALGVECWTEQDV